jgi:hypothetical protein
MSSRLCVKLETHICSKIVKAFWTFLLLIICCYSNCCFDKYSEILDTQNVLMYKSKRNIIYVYSEILHILRCGFSCIVLHNSYFPPASRSCMPQHQAEQPSNETNLPIFRGAENAVSVHASTLYRLNKLEFASWIKCLFNNFEMLVPCSRRVSDACDVYSNFASIFSSISSVSTRRFIAGLLSRNDPGVLTFLISLWMPFALGTVSREIYDEIFYDIFLRNYIS